MVKSAFKNALTRVITRILYIIIFAFIVLFISSFFNIGLVNVYAAEEQFTLPLSITLDNGDYESLVNKDNFYSNVITSEYENVAPQVSYYLFNTYELSYCEQYENSNCGIRNSPTPGWRYKDYNEKFDLIKSNYSDSTGWVSSIVFNFEDIKIIEGNHYTFLYLLDKGTNSNYNVSFNNNDNLDINLSDISIYQNNNVVSFLNNLENLTYTYHTTNQSQGSQYRYAYIKVDFDVPVGFNSSPVSYDLAGISFDLDTPNYTIAMPFDYLIQYNSTTGNNLELSQYGFFIENGNITYEGKDCVGDLCSGGGGGHSIDGVSPSDISILKSIPQCDDNDIVCHIKRVFDLISRFFIRFGNFFQDLFDDSISFDLDTNSDMTPVSNLLTMPLTLINAFLNGVDDSCSSYILGSLYGHSLTLPCINIENYLGSTLFGIIDALCSIFMIYNVGSLIVTFFDKTTSLDDMFGLLYHVRDYQIKQADDVANGVVR